MSVSVCVCVIVLVYCFWFCIFEIGINLMITLNETRYLIHVNKRETAAQCFVAIESRPRKYQRLLNSSLYYFCCPELLESFCFGNLTAQVNCIIFVIIITTIFISLLSEYVSQ